MATKLGYGDLKHVFQLPGNWDLTYLKKFQLKDGTSFDQVMVRVGTALALFNRSLTAGYWGQYMQVTSQIEKEYENGGDSATLPLYSEKERPDPIIGDTTGHMLPMNDYGGALGWTYLALRRSRMEMLDADINALINRARNIWQKQMMRRLFVTTADSVGSSGKSVPFADGGSADSSWVPPAYDGKTFLYTHNHFGRTTDDDAGRIASVNTMMDHLAEHGFSSPYDLIIPEADIATWTALTGFKKPTRDILTTAGVETRASLPDETYIGVFEGNRGYARVKFSPRLPTDYSGMFKPAGFNNVASPLAVRYEEGYPLGLSIVAQETSFPFHDAIALFTFGVGVANRLAGAATYYFSSGSYVNPTIA